MLRIKFAAMTATMNNNAVSTCVNRFPADLSLVLMLTMRLMLTGYLRNRPKVHETYRQLPHFRARRYYGQA
jgi:hypothetical protein